jgi:FkbH-like protein/FkbM family methyltransferase
MKPPGVKSVNSGNPSETGDFTRQFEERDTELKVGIGSSPYLADHGFQDMVVLPGSYCVEAVVSLHRQALQKSPAVLYSVSFELPVILSDRDTVLTVRRQRDGTQGLHFSFFESGSTDGEKKPFAKIKTAVAQDRADARPATRIRVEEFQKRAESVIQAQEFYERLRLNGNQYGPHFQQVVRVWLSGTEALGELRLPQAEVDSGRPAVHPAVMDCVTQVLSALVLQRGRTFILRSVESIEMPEVRFPETLWAHATMAANDEENDRGIVGDIVVFDDSGKVYLVLHGVSLVFLGHDESNASVGMSLHIASTFTADPVEESLRFWSSFLEIPVNIQFAPYNQVFQQLLDPESPFSRNSDGLNVILLDLEDWAARQEGRTGRAPNVQFDELFRGKNRYTLPNGFEIAHLNTYETDYSYKEVFDERIYLRHGIRLNDGDTVIDIGANIGLFSLFVSQSCAHPRIFAYEPSPIVFELLQVNAAAHGSDMHVYNLGVSDRAKVARFTFYEKSSVFSGFYSDTQKDKKAIQAIVRNMLKGQEGAETASLDEYVEELTGDRLNSKSWDVNLTSVADIISENRLERIDLLKIDAEKSELDILAGIADGDWPKIQQIVMEIHDESRTALKQIEAILSHRGFIFAVEQDTLLDESGLYNIYAVRSDATTTSAEKESSLPAVAVILQQNIDDFCSALASFMARSRVPMLLGVCPASLTASSNEDTREAIDRCERALLLAVREIPNVVAIDSRTLLHRYAVDNIFDPDGNRLAHIPYTPSFFASIGTSLFRALFNLRKHPFKVIALDCDNTLWNGVCGEDGPLGIQVTSPYRQLQEFMVAQAGSGMLICLCSKNNESDVVEVFGRRNDLALTLEHITARRINWAPKSEDLVSLARELNLGLDSFIFIDDNPVECAEVRANCPEVLTLQLPSDPASIPGFLRDIWAFDYLKVTEEDAARARMYRENLQREQYRRQSISLKGFLDGLQMQVDISCATTDEIPRISQLTFRTNQFNMTAIRRSEGEIRTLIGGNHSHCYVTRLSDRFGDYGLVGVMMWESLPESYAVDTLLLSCRALGRGVEHRMVSFLGQRAVRDGKKFVEVQFRRTAKNAPAFEFIEAVASAYRTDGAEAMLYRVPAQIISDLEYAPRSDLTSLPAEEPTNPQMEKAPHINTGTTGLSGKMQRIGEESRDLGLMLRSIENPILDRREPASGGSAGPENERQGKLIEIWRKVLRKPRIGINDNFFEAGGSSLKAVQVISQIRKEFDAQLSIVSLFECPTVISLAAKIGALGAQTSVKADETSAFQRGARRKVVQRYRKSGS